MMMLSTAVMITQLGLGVHENCMRTRSTERELIMRLHQTKEDIPTSDVSIDATQPSNTDGLA